MFEEKDFVGWLKTKGLSQSSISKYKNSIAQISTYLSHKKVIDDLLDKNKQKIRKKSLNKFNLYQLKDTKTLQKAADIYFDDEENIIKDQTGHGQWTAAVNNLIQFYDLNMSSEKINEAYPNAFDFVEFEKSVVELVALDTHGVPSGNKKPKSKIVKTVSYERDPKVVAWILKIAKGICEACNRIAPFIKDTDGQEYLEVHHVKRLADGGKDTINNAVALCPNCHKESHFGKNKAYLTKKLKKIAASHLS
tara:strand:+ start:415 stop:1164 length:750 start_codon:yes stop_codon:yes gene_type:complete